MPTCSFTVSRFLGTTPDLDLTPSGDLEIPLKNTGHIFTRNTKMCTSYVEILQTIIIFVRSEPLSHKNSGDQKVV